MQRRLAELRSEYESGQSMLADLEARHAALRQTLLRINGAIQVLEELLSAEDPATNHVSPDEGVAPTAAHSSP
jgi:hypothetical protein